MRMTTLDYRGSAVNDRGNGGPIVRRRPRPIAWVALPAAVAAASVALVYVYALIAVFRQGLVQN